MFALKWFGVFWSTRALSTHRLRPFFCFVLKKEKTQQFHSFFFFSFLLNTFFEVRCHKALIKKRRIKWRIRYFFVLKCNQPYFITQMWNIWIMGRVQWALVLSFLDFLSGRAVSGPSETLQYEGDWLVWTCVIIWPDCGPVWIQISFILEKKKGLWKYSYIPNLLFFLPVMWFENQVLARLGPLWFFRVTATSNSQCYEG